MWLGNRSGGSLGSGEEFAHWHEWVSGEPWLQRERSPEVDTLCWTLPVATLGGMAGGTGICKMAREPVLSPEQVSPQGLWSNEG